MPVEINELVISATVPSSQRVIEVESSQISPEVDGHLESATVIDRLHMPDTFTLVFRDPQRDVLESASIAIGKRIKISTGSIYADAPAVLIDGEVTSIEVEYDELGSRAVVRGYDLSHRLNAGRNSKTYQNATYSDIAKEIAGNANLETDIESTSEVHEHVIQANQSDLDFLMGLAREVDFDCRVDGDTLIFKTQAQASEGPDAGDAATTDQKALVWGTTLHEFRARISAVAQVSEVKVRGWDPKKKEAVIGQASVTAGHADLTTKPSTLAETFGSKTLFVVNEPVATQEAADALAKAKAEQCGSAAYEATAVCTGSADIRAGVTISVTGVDKLLEGKWTVSSTKHVFGDGKYTTVAECNGRQDRSLSGLVANSLASAGGGGGSGGGSQRFMGLAIGVVTQNVDPLNQGRVKLKFPWLDDQVETFWAPVAMPGAGPTYGLVWIPQVSDVVVVGFEHGDVQHPFVIGGLWNGEDVVPLDGKLFDAGKVTQSGFVSRKGHRLVFLDADDKSGIELVSANEKFKITLDETKDELHITSKSKLVIEARELEIKVDSSAKIEAGGQMTIKGATVALN
jgi:phage protein D